ncbi:hypothetical protein COS16_08950 [Candidatus Desantisbacteria bacterium CG02_land_8_20_14_3_00_49_13]|nr:MAG: hypothetical protein COS16_08950 [Candidatus Desantisbacteria bacterium CG02_land_8_20_14_3_00_49_13]
MSNEILLLKARLAEKKKSLEEAKRRADSFIIIIRDIIDPYIEDFTELDLDRAMTAMRDFARLWNEAKELKASIARMEKNLNG